MSGKQKHSPAYESHLSDAHAFARPALVDSAFSSANSEQMLSSMRSCPFLSFPISSMRVSKSDDFAKPLNRIQPATNVSMLTASSSGPLMRSKNDLILAMSKPMKRK